MGIVAWERLLHDAHESRCCGDHRELGMLASFGKEKAKIE